MRALSLVPIVLIAIAACDATKADEGLDSQMRVEGAQFFRGPMPEDPDGPTVEAVTLGTISIRAGAVNKPMSGAVAPDASAAAIALAGDLGYWIVPARVPDVLAPLNPAFKAQLSFSRALAPGPHQLIVRAVDPTGKFGAAAVRDLSADMPTVCACQAISAQIRAAASNTGLDLCRCRRSSSTTSV